MSGSYLILVEVCNDNTDKQGESNHATQKNKDVDVYAMDLQVHKYTVTEFVDYKHE